MNEFNSLAPHYRWMEVILAGGKLQRCRTRHLERVRGARSILILGEGNGRFLAECRRSIPKAQITCVDSSSRMLDLAAARLRRANLEGSTEFIHADALEWSPRERSYDLIATHFFLDCFPATELEELVPKLARAACEQSTWLVSDFCIPSTGLARHRARLIHQMMYAFFRLAARLPASGLTPPDPYLQECSFRLVSRHTTNWGLLHSDCWEHAS